MGAFRTCFVRAGATQQAILDTLGSLVGRLTPAGADEPIQAIPAPPAESTKGVVFGDASDLLGQIGALEGVEVVFELRSGPVATTRILAGVQKTALIGADGRFSIALEKTSEMKPADPSRRYLVTCEELRLHRVAFELTEDQFDLVAHIQTLL